LTLEMESLSSEGEYIFSLYFPPCTPFVLHWLLSSNQSFSCRVRSCVCMCAVLPSLNTVVCSRDVYIYSINFFLPFTL
jgi:hypothetical protein